MLRVRRLHRRHRVPSFQSSYPGGLRKATTARGRFFSLFTSSATFVAAPAAAAEPQLPAHFPLPVFRGARPRLPLISLHLLLPLFRRFRAQTCVSALLLVSHY